MKKLSIETFFTPPFDVETKQYVVLQTLKDYYYEFSHNRLYPALSGLIDLCTDLEDVIQKKIDLENHLPHRLRDLDLQNNKLIYEASEGNDAGLHRAVDLILWAIPHIKKVIDEGMNIYNFVEEHITIEEVGIVPMYREEGYWFVPDNQSAALHLLRYEFSLFTSANERFRTLKTRVLESIGQAYIRSAPESIKLELIEKYQDLPNPATYACDTDLEFPYAQTILPIAKRKLMSQVFS
jgi:hypothetical protein